MLGQLQATTGMTPMTREDLIRAGLPDPCLDTATDPNRVQWRTTNCPQVVPSNLPLGLAIGAGVILLFWIISRG